jgi:hypothetical protein
MEKLINMNKEQLEQLENALQLYQTMYIGLYKNKSL